ncbi:MAG: prepilin-type N-terminal cleavage/methylation domain-containing protein [Candidatus Levybacteria bacterium]|nr:prepilin-type N-terminal cleavage/methylation domain-containing protein [Candidatus Levybacteria bacterium]
MFWGYYSIRTIFNSLGDSGLFLWRRINSTFFGKLHVDKRYTSSGFTLIELITAMGVLAVMASAALVVINPLEQFYKSADARRKSDLAQLQRSLEIYYQDYNRYPPAFANKISADGTSNTVVDWGSDWRPYMDVLPIDPRGGKNYAYWTDNSGQSYALYASLDRGGKDSQACNGGAACAGSTGISCGGICNFGVTSPNISP